MTMYSSSRCSRNKKGRRQGRARGGGGDKKRQQSHKRRSRQKAKHSYGAARPRPRARPLFSLRNEIQLSRNTIHEWKKDLGGLIRWYANMPSQVKNKKQADRNVESMYLLSGCDVDKTKNALLNAIVNETGGTIRHNNEERDPWIDVNMVVEASDIENENYEVSSNGKGLILRKEKRKGEGPAHCSDDWNVIVVPDWAVGKTFFIEVNNQSPLNLSCEMTIDGHKVARNSPIPENSIFTIGPDNYRYFESHKWLIQPSKRIELSEAIALKRQCAFNARRNEEGPNSSRAKRRSSRCNEIRPDYKGQRVSLQDFPDAASHGWTFTGSNQLSLVEFFEIKLNIGLVKMDFYYTTATIKTVLHHPTTGANQLFRRCPASPDIYGKILRNPRFHSGIGYRRREKQDQVNEEIMDDSEEVSAQESNNDKMDDGKDEAGCSSMIFFAKNKDYDFEEEGHLNRNIAMVQLQTTEDFQAWQDAAREEWACIRAKFFVSLPKTMRRGTKGKGRKQVTEPAKLPDMTPVVNTKASENAILSTKWQATEGPNTPARTSRVRMERVKGLNDDPRWGTGPVFEYKLYYRAELTTLTESDGLTALKDGEDNMEEESQDSVDNNSITDENISLAKKLSEEMPLHEYKRGKMEQLHRWFHEIKALDQDEAQAKQLKVQNGITDATDAASVDEILKVYWDWHQRQEWLACSVVNG